MDDDVGQDGRRMVPTQTGNKTGKLRKQKGTRKELIRLCHPERTLERGVRPTSPKGRVTRRGAWRNRTYKELLSHGRGGRQAGQCWGQKKKVGEDESEKGDVTDWLMDNGLRKQWEHDKKVGEKIAVGKSEGGVVIAKEVTPANARGTSSKQQEAMGRNEGWTHRGRPGAAPRNTTCEETKRSASKSREEPLTWQVMSKEKRDKPWTWEDNWWARLFLLVHKVQLSGV